MVAIRQLRMDISTVIDDSHPVSCQYSLTKPASVSAV